MKSTNLYLFIILLSNYVVNGQVQICGNLNSANPISVTTLSEPTLSWNVPVFFHIIIGSDNSGDVMDSQLTNQINEMNNCFYETGFSCFLAGITRTVNNNWRNLEAPNFMSGPTQQEIDMKNFLSIDTDHVLNIYITSINGSIRGFSTFPWDFYANQNPKLHGVVVEPDILPGGNYSGKIIVHEVGHYLGLYHTFYEDFVCQPNVDPDLVADTPPHLPNYDCPAEGTDTCPIQSGLDPIHNFMNYTNDPCRNEFTGGQIQRMHKIVGQYRPNLGGNIINITTNRTINSGDSWKIYEGVYKFTSSNQIVVNGTLNAVGSSTNRITFTTDGSGNWSGIQFNSGSGGTFDNCDITYATIGVKAYNSSPQIYRTNIDNCGTGVYCDYYASPNLYYNNIRYAASYGVYCNVYSSPNFLGGGSYSGYNVIKNENTGNYGIYAIYN